MDSGRILGIVLLVIGVALLFYGIQAGDSLSSGFSKLFQGAPSNKSLWLMIAGALCAAVGIVKLVRRRTT